MNSLQGMKCFKKRKRGSSLKVFSVDDETGGSSKWFFRKRFFKNPIRIKEGNWLEVGSFWQLIHRMKFIAATCLKLDVPTMCANSLS